MSFPPSLANLVGQWSGTNHLWLSPTEPASESATVMIVAMTAQDQFFTLHYSWSYEGTPQDGLLLLGYEEQLNITKAVWVDSFHMQDKFMVCEGFVEDDGKIVIKGSYAAPPGPDWGWQISLAMKSSDQFEFVMHNITPEGDVHLAVKATYLRKP